MELDGSINNAQILIIDDVPENVILLRSVLTRAGFTNLTSTTDSREALSLFNSIRPDLILLDLKMPYLDGFEVMEQLKPLIPPGTYLPILMLTADITNEAKHRALSMMAKGFLVKPLDAVEVVLHITNLLETRFLHLQLQTQNYSLEHQVRQRTAALSQSLSDLMSAQESERRRLSMDLHDGPLQTLGVTIMTIDRAVIRHQRQEYEAAERELLAIRKQVAETITEMRDILGDLSIQTLTARGLAYALRAYIERFSDITGIGVTFLDHLPVRLSARLELLMYRLAQEALANVRKHSKAANASLSLEIDGSDLVMSISDDGIGFDPEAVFASHSAPRAGERLGLLSMRQRIQNAQGRLTIRSTQGESTVLEFRCPTDQAWN